MCFLNVVGHGSEVVYIMIKYAFALFLQVRNYLTFIYLHLTSIYCRLAMSQALETFKVQLMRRLRICLEAK